MIVYILLAIASVFVYLFFRKKSSITFKDEHIMISGGSSGIGLSLAILAARSGSNVTIIARSEIKLETAKEKILSEMKNPKQKILSFSLDVSDKNNCIESVIKESEEANGPISVLINCAGTSICLPFLETPVESFAKMLDINYLGSVYTTYAVLPLMKERKSGSIVFVSSIAGLMGLYGYSAYSASKFALVGLAESLQMEVKPYNINITISFPPDTDTPGFAEEIKTKPLETQCISESAGLFPAEKVALGLLQDIKEKKFMSTIGFESKIICALCSGMTPRNSFLELMFQVITMGFLRLASVILHSRFDSIIQKCHTEKQKLKEKN